MNHAQRDRELEAALRDAEREGDRARAARRAKPLKAGPPSAADMSQALAALAKAEEQLAARTRQLDRVTARNALLEQELLGKEQELLELRKRPAAAEPGDGDGAAPQAKKRKEGEEEAAAAAPAAPEDQRDWAGLPTEVLVDVARRLQRSTHARYAARKRKLGERVNGVLGAADDPSLDVHGLFAFAMVCKGWRAAQVRVGNGKLKTRATCVLDHHHLPLLLWALRQGLPTVPPDTGYRYSGYYRRRTTAKTNLCDLAAFVGFAGGLRYLHAATGTHALKSLKVTKNTTTHALRGGCVEVLEFLDSPSMKWSTPVSSGDLLLSSSSWASLAARRTDARARRRCVRRPPRAAASPRCSGCRRRASRATRR